MAAWMVWDCCAAVLKDGPLTRSIALVSSFGAESATGRRRQPPARPLRPKPTLPVIAEMVV
jgi:hypothetical protein